MIRNSACIILLLAIAILVDLIASTVASVAEHSHGRAWRHRHRLRHGRSPRRHKPNLGSQLPFPTPTTPVDFQFTASHYNLSVYENSIDQRAVAADPSNPQMVGVWLPRGYNQIQFKIIEGDPQDRFGVSAKRIGNFAFLQLEPKGQMDVLNRELQPKLKSNLLHVFGVIAHELGHLYRMNLNRELNQLLAEAANCKNCKPGNKCPYHTEKDHDEKWKQIVQIAEEFTGQAITPLGFPDDLVDVLFFHKNEPVGNRRNDWENLDQMALRNFNF